jgi:formate dehydrogenase maturation protein FdhE
MMAAPTRDDTVPNGRSRGACPQCGTVPDGPSLLTSMTRYYVCGRCAARWSVTRDWLTAPSERSR